MHTAAATIPVQKNVVFPDHFHDLHLGFSGQLIGKFYWNGE